MTLPEPSPPANIRNPNIATALSLIVPGLGHFYLGRRTRGQFILLTAFVLLILIWWLDLLILLPLILPFWLYSAWDARNIACRRRHSTLKLVLTAAIMVYGIGWHVTQIDVQQLVVGAPKIKPFVAGLLQPDFLERDITYGTSLTTIEVPCSEGPPVPTVAQTDPIVVIDRACANPGEEIVVSGSGFPPSVEGALWWINTIGDRSRLRRNGSFVEFQADDQGQFDVVAVVPAVTNTEPQVQRLEARYIVDIGRLQLSETGWLVLRHIGETIALALMATTFGAIIALFLSFFAARNLMQFNPVAKVVYYLMRSIFNILRAIEPLIMAIVFVVWVGLGPFAGVLALTVHTIAALGKLYSEAIEGIESGPIEAITVTGANRPQIIWYGVVPQVLPPFIAFTVYRWDINVRMSTIIGFVGGGGIGFLLQQWIRLTDFRAAGAAILAIAIVVTVLDFASSEVRKRVV